MYLLSLAAPQICQLLSIQALLPVHVLLALLQDFFDLLHPPLQVHSTILGRHADSLFTVPTALSVAGLAMASARSYHRS